MTPVAVRRTHDQLDLLRQVLACEVIVASQALEMRKLDRTAPVAQAIHDAIRPVVSLLDEDRSMTVEVQQVAGLIKRGTLFDAIRAARNA